MGEEIKKIEGVNTCKFKTKQEALEQMKESLKEYDGDLMETYEGENNISCAFFREYEPAYDYVMQYSQYVEEPCYIKKDIVRNDYMSDDDWYMLYIFRVRYKNTYRKRNKNDYHCRQYTKNFFNLSFYFHFMFLLLSSC